jgi:hypothetical protein
VSLGGDAGRGPAKRGRGAPSHDPGVLHEPQFRAAPVDFGQADDLGDEPVRAGTPNGFDAESSVRDEPSLAWNGAGIAGVRGYADLLEERRRSTPAAWRWGMVAGLALAAGPFGIFGAFWSMFGGGTGLGYLALVVVGPVVEEMTKIALLLWVAEKRPWLLPGAGAVVLSGFLAGAGFGAIENLVYLHVYFPDRAAEIAPWRWLATAPMHAIASAIAAVGVARMWHDGLRRQAPPRIPLASPWIALAIVLHGAFNAVAIALHLAGIAP